MPVYEYVCRNCRKKFTVMLTIAERDTKRVRCPKCNSLKVAQQISAFHAMTAKKS